ncbi:aldolase/citrate lyase family protein [Rhodovulum sulfidophilum]|nr:aldolase/citrate lyase family protein [Rhodovulum sulfidophilum]
MCKNTDLARYPLVTQLAFGLVDYCADLGCAHSREALLSARSELVLASRLAGIAPPLDGVTTDLTDPGVIAEDARHARQLGMGGKMCIHPAQVAAGRMALDPTDAEVDWARRVMAAGDGAVTLDGQMVDIPVRLRAAAVLRSLSSGEPR